MSRTLVIGEMGSCHDGDYEKALCLIEVAKMSGCDVLKGQYWSSAKRLAERRRAPTYEAIYAKYQVPVVWLSWLALACKAAGLEFMCTTYLPEDIADVAPFVQRFKVASFEAGDKEFIDAHAKYDKEVIISTGMAEGRFLNSWDTYLHCVSAYPCPLDQANLGAIGGFLSGYSDHTHNVQTGAFAVCAGAKILEVHFRLDDTDPANPDYATALTPAELAEYVRLVRLAEVMLGDGIKRPQPAEAAMMPYRVGP